MFCKELYQLASNVAKLNIQPIKLSAQASWLKALFTLNFSSSFGMN